MQLLRLQALRTVITNVKLCYWSEVMFTFDTYQSANLIALIIGQCSYECYYDVCTVGMLAICGRRKHSKHMMWICFSTCRHIKDDQWFKGSLSLTLSTVQHWHCRENWISPTHSWTTVESKPTFVDPWARGHGPMVEVCTVVTVCTKPTFCRVHANCCWISSVWVNNIVPVSFVSINIFRVRWNSEEFTELSQRLSLFDASAAS